VELKAATMAQNRHPVGLKSFAEEIHHETHNPCYQQSLSRKNERYDGYAPEYFSGKIMG